MIRESNTAERLWEEKESEALGMAATDVQVKFDAPAILRKWPSLKNERVSAALGARPSSTALLPWSPSTGTGGRHPPETVVAFNRKPWSP